MGASVPVYDRIGGGYAGGRRTDPRIAAVLTAALGDAGSVVNVGAGTGSYEPGWRGYPLTWRAEGGTKGTVICSPSTSWTSGTALLSPGHSRRLTGSLQRCNPGQTH
jgi:hypothetical protein